MNGPSSWLTGNANILPAGGHALDVACGYGRNACWLAERGFVTDALDRDETAVAFVNDEAGRRGIPVRATLVDLEVDGVSFGTLVYHVICVTNYLHRPLFPALVQALAPGGVLVYETFTRAQAARGKPTNPAFLLEPGELRRLLAPLDVVLEREGEFDGRMASGIIARRGIATGLRRPRQSR